ncbi:LamB/YcsF family protein [Lentilitoribacter sp. EG35]|uniref:LamB/YcsF family protein n=1 Tax=Lentilitoribacter sp. EG35 TaxID=3234192 RepID=UPI003460BB28
MTHIDLNADLGESFGPWVMGSDAEMMDVITSANIACGGHAGDHKTMVQSLQMAKEKSVVAGAHPGFEDKEGFGRRRIPLTSREIEYLIAAQVGTIKGLAEFAGNKITYVKVHGALSNWAAKDIDVSRAITRSIKAAHSDCAILAVSGTQIEIAAREIGLDVYSEIFADRAYDDDGNLVARSIEGAVLESAEVAADRLLRFFETGKMPTINGGEIALDAHSICIHGDNAHAVAMAKEIHSRLTSNGIVIAPFMK